MKSFGHAADERSKALMKVSFPAAIATLAQRISGGKPIRRLFSL